MTALPELLGLGSDTAPISLTAVQFIDWGRTLAFEGTTGDKRFTLRYADCRDIRWRAYVAMGDSSDATTPVVDFATGRDQHRSPMQMLTGAFGLTLFYGSLAVTVETSDEG